MRISLYTDGGARNNPGPAGIGGVAFAENGREVFSFKEYLGEKTNNQAEYLALIKGLNLAYQKGVEEVDCFLDSELVVKQLNGLYKIKHEDLKPLARQVRDFQKDFVRISFNFIPREKNKNADKLVNEAIDEGLGIK